MLLRLAAVGWLSLNDETFPSNIGQVFQRSVVDGFEIGLLCDRQQSNLSGVVHGGAIMTLFDRSMGLNCRSSVDWPMVTASMSVNFLRPAMIGQFLRFTCTVVKIGQSAVFAESKADADNKIIAVATGTFVRRSWTAPVDSEIRG
jgi:acyl-coenzyme A thioesterase 13